MRVAVTGATGFVGSEVTKTLLERGYAVHGTVRDPDDEAKVSPLTNLPGATERLTLFRADLLSSEGFEPAFAGCDVIRWGHVEDRH
jgi:cinnamoyl-CoA reductase